MLLRRPWSSTAAERSTSGSGNSARFVELFDSLVDTPASGDGLPIRFVTLHEEEQTITAAQKLLASGFYTSAVFFPVIGRGKAGLRLMLRADLPHATIERFADVLRSVTE